MWRSTLSSEDSSGGAQFPSLPGYIYRTGVTFRAPDPPASLDLGERKVNSLDKARDSTGGPEPIESHPGSYNTTAVGSMPDVGLACTSQLGSS